ncbi:MAG: hypothetical protein ABS79_03965 [Planctomycetes bacterium SCN 63-9]|nr:MAG: hypothetical protein ABS79_03965 [Planctomycetes bacterium SCN 63-9]
MRAVVDYQDDRIEFEIAEDRLVASFQGPSDVLEADRVSTIVDALNRPLEFPPVSRMFVPGDRIAIALDSRTPDARSALLALVPVVREAIGDSGEIIIVQAPGDGPSLASEAPAGTRIVVHDPNDQTELAYLASTKEGRRIYLNRHLVDADAVIPIGELRHDPFVGYRGPWNALFPALSDAATRNDYRSLAPGTPGQPADANARLGESFEVSWLLGAQFFLGFVPGCSGFAEVIAGIGSAVRDQGIKRLEQTWTFRADSRADLVVAGIGRPGLETGLEELAAGITAAAGLVQHGGKIAILSHARGGPGPALKRLIEAGDPRRGTAALKSAERDEDYAIALRLNRAMAWADLYLLSDLDSQMVEDLSAFPLERADAVNRLVAVSRSCTFLSQADLARVGLADES